MESIGVSGDVAALATPAAKSRLHSLLWVRGVRRETSASDVGAAIRR